MKKNITSLIFSSFLFVACGIEGANANKNKVNTENVKPVAVATTENKTEVIDVKDAPVETVKNYPTEKWYDGVSFGGGLGTLGGINFQLGYRFPGNQSFLKNRLGFRVEYNTMNPIWNYAKTNYIDGKLSDFKLDIEGSNLDTDLLFSARNFGLNLDLYPFGKLWGLGNIRLSTGYYFGKFEFGANGVLKVTNKKKISDDIFVESVAGNEPKLTVNAFLKDRITGPYLGAGWDLWLPFGFKLFVDGGVVFGSGLDVVTDVKAEGKVKVTGSRGGVSVSEIKDFSGLDELKDIDKKIKKEMDKQVDELKEKYSDYTKLFPMIKLGIIYRF